MVDLLVLLPLFMLIVFNLPRVRRVLRKAEAPFICALCLFQAYVSLFKPAWFWGAEGGAFGLFFRFPFYADDLTTVVLAAIGIVVPAALISLRATTPDEKRRESGTNLLLLVFMSMDLIALSGDLFSFYVFIEITAIGSFILIALNREKEALGAAFNYLVLSSAASLMMLFSVGIFIMKAGGTSLEAVSMAMGDGGAASAWVKTAVALFTAGLLIKSGVVPFHGWLPDAYQKAPAGVSVLLAGIVTKAGGVYVLMRLVVVLFGFSRPLTAALMALGALSIVIGALSALGQKDMKRMLAYSSVSQVGYIVLALGAGSKLALCGAVFHFFNHAVFKSLLFVNAAAVEKELGTTRMEKMGGLSVKMPVAGTTSVIGFLSTAGIPPLAGFWSKLIIIVALWNDGYSFYAGIALLASLVTIAYFLSLERNVFFGRLAEGLEGVRETGAALKAAQIALAAITVLVGVFFPFVFSSFIFLAVKELR